MKSLSPDEFTDIFPAFRQGSGELVSEILSKAILRDFPAGMLVYTEGDACPAIAFLLSGEIRVYKAGEAGREITLYEIGRGETCILNASCIISDASYPANALSLTEGSMLLLPATDFRRLMDRYEEMRRFVFEIISQRLADIMALVEEVAFGRMDQRLMDYLKERAGGGVLHATHRKIADDLGSSREVISRLLKDLERRGVVELSRNLITILKPAS